MQKGDAIDFSVGVVMHVELGSAVKKGDVLCEVYHNNGKKLAEAKELIARSITISSAPAAPHKIAYAYVDKHGVEMY